MDLSPRGLPQPPSSRRGLPPPPLLPAGLRYPHLALGADLTLTPVGPFAVLADRTRYGLHGSGIAAKTNNYEIIRYSIEQL